ncbi:ScbA/BarX family gamma-butyrolactone biosynthesis protein [Streptomyces sp. NPDC006368]|uniref:ScbA/BarX family gamma-butyrolactone biosynthesis protein n=1 Tax=Streptomyces sp. NPDC006368 TaxID=3156760 RepID=UPI0033A93BC7
MVHRIRTADAFPTSWARTGEHRFTVTAVLPHDHSFFAPVHGDRHDPLLLAETMRQSAMLVFHAGYGVPLDYHFLMASLDCTSRPEGLAVGTGPTEVEVEVVCSALKWRGGRPFQGRVDWVVRRSGAVVATGVGVTRFTSPPVYRRMRGDQGLAPPPAGPVALPPAARTGRARADDVVLSETAQENVWQLRVDTTHSTLFQRPNDHVPGMLLLEAARQAAGIATAPSAFVPATVSTRFHRYAEFDRPCWVQAHVTGGGTPETTSVRVTGSQDDALVFSAVLSGPAVTDSPS